jgi:hypothetical protein
MDVGQRATTHQRVIQIIFLRSSTFLEHAEPKECDDGEEAENTACCATSDRANVCGVVG